MVDDWHRLVGRYMKNRHGANLKHVFLLIDSRRGITSVDQEFIDLLTDLNTSFQIVFTKIDTLSQAKLEENLKKAEEKCLQSMTMHPIIHLVSSKESFGLREIRNQIVAMCGLLRNVESKKNKANHAVDSPIH